MLSFEKVIQKKKKLKCFFIKITTKDKTVKILLLQFIYF